MIGKPPIGPCMGSSKGASMASDVGSARRAVARCARYVVQQLNQHAGIEVRRVEWVEGTRGEAATGQLHLDQAMLTHW